MDKLEDIVDLQTKLKERIEEERQVNFKYINNALKQHIHAIDDEKGELRRELDWKWWTNKKDIDIDACKEELIDMLHFLIQALIILGCDADEIHSRYVEKNRTNHDRQDGKTDRKGYDPDSDENYENVD